MKFEFKISQKGKRSSTWQKQHMHTWWLELLQITTKAL